MDEITAFLTNVTWPQALVLAALIVITPTLLMYVFAAIAGVCAAIFAFVIMAHEKIMEWKK